LLENYYLPGDLAAQVEAFARQPSALPREPAQPDPADVYFGRGQAILLERERIKRQTIQQRRLIHQQHAA
jgi:hypothetical protein